MENQTEMIIENQIEVKQKKSILELLTILLYFVGHMIVGAIILVLVASVFAVIKVGISSDMNTDLLTEVILEYTFKGQFFLDLAFLTTFIILWRKRLSFKVLENKNKKQLALYTSIGAVAFLVCNILLGLIIELIIGPGTSTNQEAIESLVSIAPLTLVFTTVFFAPIVEELVFRGSIYTMIRKKASPLTTILITGAIFALLHVIFGLIGGEVKEIVYFIQYFAMGCAFGYVYHKTDSLHVCIAIHMINNLMGVLFIFLL